MLAAYLNHAGGLYTFPTAPSFLPWPPSYDHRLAFLLMELLQVVLISASHLTVHRLAFLLGGLMELLHVVLKPPHILPLPPILLSTGLRSCWEG